MFVRLVPRKAVSHLVETVSSLQRYAAPAAMTVAELVTSILDAGEIAITVAAILPLVLGAFSYMLRQQGRNQASQVVANVGIGLGFFSLLVVICWTIYASNVPGMIGSTNVLVFVVPIYLLVVSFGVEHLLHPGRQESIRERVRKVALFVIVLGVLYLVLSRLDYHMVIWTNVLGFVFFIGALIGILYLLVRRVV